MARLHRVDEAADLLGVSRETVYRLIAAGDLASCDVAPTGSRASKTRIPDTAITAFIAARTRKPKRQLRSA